jgi:hypothetical protein
MVSCDSPSPAMMGTEAQRIDVDGATFSVRVRGTRAEAIRLNPMPMPSIGAVIQRAGRAMELASGCRVIGDSIRGDPALLRADLDCG